MTTIPDPNVYAHFWDHVDELRKTLIRMLAIIVCGMIASFMCYGPLITFLTKPLIAASLEGPLHEERLEHIRIVNDSASTKSYTIPHGTSHILHQSGGIEQLSAETFKIPPGETLIYLKASPKTPQLVVLGPLEGMLIALKTSLWVGGVATSPLWLLVWLRFLLPGMHQGEKRLVIPFLLTSLAFISLGCLFAYTCTIPIANSYLFSFNQTIGTNLWSLGHYLDYTLFLLLANGLAFELCAIGIFAVHLGIVSAQWLASNRRYAIVGAFITGALLTPPDVLTQLMLAIPLIILYEGIILYARLIHLKVANRT